MQKFDLLVVYSAKLAHSAGSKNESIAKPFAAGSKNESYNIVYSYFLETCRKKGLSAAFTTSADIVGPGKCKDYWLYQKRRWIRVNKICYSKVIFDKFSPTNKRIKVNRDLLFSSPRVLAFNNPYVYNLFFDKQKTYNKLSRYSIPTITIEKNTITGIKTAYRKLKKLIKVHSNRNDFSEEIVLKDRFGAGGFDVYKFKMGQTNEILQVLKDHGKKSFIIQTLIKFDKGYSYRDSTVSADIRLIHLDSKLIQTYVRMAKTGDFRCNEHQGGTLKYMAIKSIPNQIVTTSQKVIKAINRTSALTALDFIVSNNGNVYLLEGNTGPGLDWNLSLKENEREAKKLIKIVVNKLSSMVSRRNIANKRNTLKIKIDTSPLIAPITPTPDFLTI